MPAVCLPCNSGFAVQMLAEGGAFGRMRGGRGMRGGARGPGGRGLRGLGAVGRLGMGPMQGHGPFSPGPRGMPHYMGGRGQQGNGGDLFPPAAPLGMQGFGQGPFGDLPGQKRNFASAMNMDLLGGSPVGGMGGIAPLGNMMEGSPGFHNPMQVGLLHPFGSINCGQRALRANAAASHILSPPPPLHPSVIAPFCLNNECTFEACSRQAALHPADANQATATTRDIRDLPV